MKKIPTLFKRQFENHKVVGITPEVTEGMEWVLKGEGVATIKWDGSACAIIDGELYRRYDAKNGKPIPEGAIKCQEEPDPITGHLPCWVKCDRNNPSDKWFISAFDILTCDSQIPFDGTFEVIGEHFNGNPYRIGSDMLLRHGCDRIDVERTFEGIKEYLRTHEIEGIVFWRHSQPMCKIKRTDFGFPWNNKR